LKEEWRRWEVGKMRKCEDEKMRQGEMETRGRGKMRRWENEMRGRGEDEKMRQGEMETWRRGEEGAIFF
jgi:hypothetical protein